MTASSIPNGARPSPVRPCSAGALAALDCRVTDIMPLDTHSILIGVVEDILFGPRGRRSIHFEGGYTSLLSALSETLS